MERFDKLGAEMARRVRRYSREIYDQFRAPHGVDVLRDIRQHTHRSQLSVIFDVGANVGQASVRYAREFPDARVYAFEPSDRTFAALQRAVHKSPNVQCVKMALGSGSGQELSDEPGPATGTVDGFCENENIANLDLLKVDTRGDELAVLEGADGRLRDQRIAFVQVKVGFRDDLRSAERVSLQAHRKYLEARGYSLFGFYDQVVDATGGRSALRSCQAVFIAQRELDTMHARYCVEHRPSRRP